MNRKIEKAKKKRQLEAQSRELQEKGIKASESLEKAIHSLSELINGQDEYDFARLEKQLEKIDKSLDLTKHFTNLERSIKQLSPQTHNNKTKIQDFSKLLKAVTDNKPLPVNIDLTKLEKAVVNIEQYISEQSEPSDQGAENYQPVRRVVKVGNRFIFDDNFTNAGGGGGSSTVGLTDAELRASPVPVSMSSDIEIGAVELKNGTDDTRAEVTAGNALKVDGSAVTQPVSGTVTETNSAAIKTAVETIDNAISGNEMQVDVVGALPAGTNAIGKLAANSGVDIGDVDVTSSVTSSLDHGSNLDIDTTAEQITSTSFACKFGVTVKADITNTGIIYVGNSDVTAGSTAATDGFPLSAGETLTLEVNNPNLLYAIASANNQKIYWVAN